MKAVVLYCSKAGHTKKVAQAIAKGLKKQGNARALNVENAKIESVANADVIGFGSGIYYGQPAKELVTFLNKLPSMTGRLAFVFSTSGTGGKLMWGLAAKLEDKGFKVLGEFACRAYDDWGPLKLIGGINKGRPNSKDLKKAEEFGETVTVKE